jgi:diaminopimelate decarboxylase
MNFLKRLTVKKMKTIANVDISEIAGQFGTPVYVYDAGLLRQNYTALKSAFRKYYQNTSIHYSIKANSNLYICKLFKDLGSGADTSSPFEVRLARLAGFEDQAILYTGNYESHDDLSEIARSKVKVNLDDLTSFYRFLKFGIPEQVSFRINPGIGRGGFEGITTAGTDAKFGIPYEKAFDAYRIAKDAGVKKFGIHMMTGSNNLEPYHFAEATDKLLKIAGSVFNRLGISPEYIDIGGGFGIPYSDDETPLNIEETARLISEIITERSLQYHFPLPELIIEPGRYLVGNAGHLVSQVTGVKQSYRVFVGLDAGMNTLIRQALYGASHRISVYNKEKVDHNVSVCGNICENSDIFSKAIFLPEVDENDLLVFADAGAYGYSMASNYNNRPRPAEVLIDQGKCHLIRRREIFEDLLDLYPGDQG